MINVIKGNVYVIENGEINHNNHDVEMKKKIKYIMDKNEFF